MIASDMVLIGVVDSELVSRLGEFSVSLLQQGIRFVRFFYCLVILLAGRIVSKAVEI